MCVCVRVCVCVCAQGAAQRMCGINLETATGNSGPLDRPLMSFAFLLDGSQWKVLSEEWCDLT